MNCKHLYNVFDGDELVFSGTAAEITSVYNITSVTTCLRDGGLINGKYRLCVDTLTFFPKDGEPYFFYSTRSGKVHKDYWNDFDTNCIMRWKCKNVFKTDVLANEFGYENMEKIRADFLEHRGALHD